MQRPRHYRAIATMAAALSIAPVAHADFNIGVIVSTTGPAASLGISEEQAVHLWPSEIDGQKVNVRILNDGSDTGTAAKQASRLIVEDGVDVIVGSSTTPTTLAILSVAAEAGVPVVSLAGGRAIVEPQTGVRRWAFKLSPTETISANIVLDHFLKSSRNKTMGTIALSNSYGDGALQALEETAAKRNVKIATKERYNSNDQTVTAQVIRLISINPDAVYILSTGTAAALPHTELVKRGYRGTIYQTQGIANADFLRVGGKEVEGSFATVAPVLVAEQLNDSHPTKNAGMRFLKVWDEKYGAKSRSLFAATAWDAHLVLYSAASKALKKAKPGTPDFRNALRDSLESTKMLVGTEGVFNMSQDDHNGVDNTSQVLVKIDKGTWKLAL